MAKNDGGPAFPTGPDTEVTHSEFGPDEHPTGNHPGMSLRDWFAGQTLAHISQPILDAMSKVGHPPHREEVARICYQIADAMLKERGK